MADLQISSVTKSFGKNVIVDDVSLAIEHGQLVTLVGPSGCGKTTTLRMVAGFLKPNSGAIYIGAEDVTLVPPYKRDTGMVFQQYALFPHMTVTKNVEFGLRMRKVPKHESKKLIQEALDLVGLGHLGDRYPRQLSGGQQQRVALARVLVIRPKVLLFDEPLSNLDAKLRLEMRLEIKRIQQEVGITALFVTHDQEEAITISDKIAVMNNGVIEQFGTPMEVFDRPQTKFVADFVGTSNFFEGVIVDVDSESESAVFQSNFGLTVKIGKVVGVRKNDSGYLGIRPEKIIVKERVAEDSETNTFDGVIKESTWMGPSSQYLVTVKGEKDIIATEQNMDTSRIYQVGEKVSLQWLPENCLYLKKS